MTICRFSLMKSDLTTKILHPAQHKYLSPTGVIPVAESYTTAVWDLLEKEGSRFEGVSIPLRDFALPVLYQASAYAFFGRSCPVMESYEPFNDFDGEFYLLLAGVPRVFLRKHLEGLTTMHTLFEKYFDNPHEDASGLVLENEKAIRDQGHVCFHLPFAVNRGLLIGCDSRIRKLLRLSLFLSSSL